MKKVLSTVAALGLVMGVAATASALDLSVTGHYSMLGVALSEADATSGGVQLLESATAAGNTWMEHDMRIYPTLKVNDNITMKADIRLLNDEMFDDTQDGTHEITANKIYMIYKSPIGTWTMGKTAAGAWGSPFLNNATTGNRIIYQPDLGDSPFSMKLIHQRNNEADGGAGSMNSTAEQDQNQYYAHVGYKTDAVNLTALYIRTRYGANDTDKDDIFAQAVLPLGPANIVTEIHHGFGDTPGSNAVSRDTWGGMLLVTGKIAENVNAGAIGFYASGQDANSTDDENEMGAAGLGADFEPLYIMTGDNMGILNGSGGANAVATNALIQESGVKAIGAFADFTASPKLTLHAAVGTGWADETAAGQDDEYGWEFDLGASYKLLDNLTYDLHFGYWAIGDYVKPLGEPNDVSLVTHSLTMTF